jgi:hypothetical protein
LQLFVSSALTETGMPFISVVPVAELLRYEYPDASRLTDLTKDSIIDLLIQNEPMF